MIPHNTEEYAKYFLEHSLNVPVELHAQWANWYAFETPFHHFWIVTWDPIYKTMVIPQPGSVPSNVRSCLNLD